MKRYLGGVARSGGRVLIGRLTACSLAIVLLLLAGCRFPAAGRSFRVYFDFPRLEGMQRASGSFTVQASRGRGRAAARGVRHYDGVVTRIDLDLRQGGKNVAWASREAASSRVRVENGRRGDRVVIEAHSPFVTFGGMIQMQKVVLELPLPRSALRQPSLGAVAGLGRKTSRGARISLSTSLASKRPRVGQGTARVRVRRR